MHKNIRAVSFLIKIIFSDMDGTLLDSRSQLPVGFDEMMSELKRRGVIFAPASGRQYQSLLRSFGGYKDDFLFVAENGTLAMRHDEEIFSRAMRRAEADRVIEFGLSLKNIFIVFCGKKSSYYLESQFTPEGFAEFEKYFTKNIAVESFADVDDEPLKISMFDVTKRAAENIYPYLRAEFEGPLQVDLSSDQWVDVMSAGINKGVAIRNVQRILNVAPEECAAFGDYLNDYEMMKAVARCTTLSNDEAGVLVGIRKLIAEGLL